MLPRTAGAKETDGDWKLMMLLNMNHLRQAAVAADSHSPLDPMKVLWGAALTRVAACLMADGHKGTCGYYKIQIFTHGGGLVFTQIIPGL